MIKTVSLFEKTERMKSILVGVATGESYHDEVSQKEYSLIRKELIENSNVKKHIPKFVLSCRQLNEFWGYIKPLFGSYAERREHLRIEFDPLLTHIETNTFEAPSDKDVSEVLKALDSTAVNSIWKKAVERRLSDPEGALTMARTLLESTIKHILDDLHLPYAESDELPRLYKNMAKELDLAPNKETEQIFKQLLSGCHNVVEGIGAMRNKLSDAHGKGRVVVSLSPRHVELSVNMSGILATFWIKTFESQKPF